jgi:integrase
MGRKQTAGLYKRGQIWHIEKQVLGQRNIAATEWIDENGLTWLLVAPKIKLLQVKDARAPSPLSWSEQSLLLEMLPLHLNQMARFKVNTGCREQEVCQLRWEWEKHVPSLNTSVFIIPSHMNRDGE